MYSFLDPMSGSYAQVAHAKTCMCVDEAQILHGNAWANLNLAARVSSMSRMRTKRMTDIIFATRTRTRIRPRRQSRKRIASANLPVGEAAKGLSFPSLMSL